MKDPGPVALATAAVAERYADMAVRERGTPNRGEILDGWLAAVGLLPEAIDEPGPSWCGVFVDRCIGEADGTVPEDFPRGRRAAWTPSYAAWAQRQALWIPALVSYTEEHAPMRGDLALFWFEARGRIAHVGIVTGKTYAGRLLTVEGNTAHDPRLGEQGVTREGDGVYRKARRCSDLGRLGGFARLPF